MPTISERAKAAIALLPKIGIGFREHTGECMGVFLDDGEQIALPIDPLQRRAIGILNDELRRENPHLRFEEQVWFVSDN